MENKKIQRLACIVLVLVMALPLTACGDTVQTIEPTVWTDPHPEIRGTIEDGVYLNTWLNLTYKTTCDPAFLADYNRISGLANPESNRWCELHEFNSAGESLLLTVENMREDQAFEEAANERCAEFHERLNNTDPDIDISATLVETQNDYQFNGNVCTMYHYTLTTKHADTVLDEKNDVMLFWEKDGYLIALRQVSSIRNQYSRLDRFRTYTQESTPEPVPATHNILKVPSCWRMEYKKENYIYQFALLPDGTCYLVFEAFPWVGAGFSGTYTITDNILTITIDFHSKGAYDVIYAVDTQAQTLTQVSEQGFPNIQEIGIVAGVVYDYQPAEIALEEIVDRAVLMEQSGGLD